MADRFNGFSLGELWVIKRNLKMDSSPLGQMLYHEVKAVKKAQEQPTNNREVSE